MSFTHIASFRWTAQTIPADVDLITTALTELSQKLGGVHSYRCGPDVSRVADSYDYAVVAVFGSRDEFLAYRDHPEHQRILKELIAPHLENRILVQLQG